MTERSKDPLFQIADLQKKLEVAIKPLAKLDDQIRAIKGPVISAREFETAIDKILKGQKRFAKTIESLGFGPLDKFSKKMARASRNMQALDVVGLLPHYSTPFDFVDEYVGDTAALRQRLSQHYRDCWQDVREDIESRLTNYRIDDEAKATFREALDAHEAGLHRSVCRLLLPEIERVARIELHGDRLEHMTNQRLLRELTGRLTPGEIEPRGYYGLILFRHLTEHLYEPVKTEADRQRFAQDPVPNRHAAVHGLVTYSSPLNSLNTIFMADYVFQVISYLKGLTR